MKNFLLMWIFVTIFMLIGCNTSVEVSEVNAIVPSATEVMVASPTDTSSPSATQTSTLTPTVTLTPSITPSPTATFTSTPIPVPQLSIAKSFSSSYSGVASYAPLVAGFAQGTVISVLGVSPDSNWLLIEIPPGQNAWIQKEDVEILNPEIDLLVVEVTPPPTPTPTSAAPPQISVIIKDTGYGDQDLNLQFFNFQPGERISVVIYDDVKVFKRNNGVSTGSTGFGNWHVGGRLNIKKSVTYRIVADGSLGSHAEKTFTR